MKPIPTHDRWGHLSETFLQLDPEGRVEVKDGRTLEEYINDPRLCALRKRYGQGFHMVVCSLDTYNWGIFPYVA